MNKFLFAQYNLMVINMQIQISQDTKKLSGSVKINGSKNASLPIIACAMLRRGIVTLNNVPRIDDVFSMIDIMSYFDVVCNFSSNTLIIDSTNVQYSPIFSSKHNIRGSYYFIPVSMLLFGKAKIFNLGGCKIGLRPIDYHIKAFKDMGCIVTQEEDGYFFKYSNVLNNKITLSGLSVGASINSIILSMYSKETKISNVSMEPEVIDVCNFLQNFNRKITIKNHKVKSVQKIDRIKDIEYSIIPDRIEAATYMIIGAASRGIEVYDVNTRHLKNITKVLKQIGAKVSVGKDRIKVSEHKLKGVKVKVGPYPLFSTDIQPLLCPLLLCCKNESVIEDNIFENRFLVCKQLRKMNGDIMINKNKIIISPSNIKPSDVEATDLRCCAALVIAGLLCEGVSKISDADYINRGYENIVYNLNEMGANINIIKN